MLKFPLFSLLVGFVNTFVPKDSFGVADRTESVGSIP